MGHEPGGAKPSDARAPNPQARSNLRCEIDDLYADYVAFLDTGELDRWLDLFTQGCTYKIIPRENYERRLPLALVLCESKGMLRDRIEALQRASVYAPRALRHMVSSLRIRSSEAGAMRVQANYLVVQTLIDEHTQVFNAGLYLDTLVRQDGQLRFQEKLCVSDTVLIPGSLVYPL
jgi:3-phenylpropionate/cinnamic acid dioxygenase small subunit